MSAPLWLVPAPAHAAATGAASATPLRDSIRAAIPHLKQAGARRTGRSRHVRLADGLVHRSRIANLLIIEGIPDATAWSALAEVGGATGWQSEMLNTHLTRADRALRHARWAVDHPRSLSHFGWGPNEFNLREELRIALRGTRQALVLLRDMGNDIGGCSPASELEAARRVVTLRLTGCTGSFSRVEMHGYPSLPSGVEGDPLENGPLATVTNADGSQRTQLCDNLCSFSPPVPPGAAFAVALPYETLVRESGQRYWIRLLSSDRSSSATYIGQGPIVR